MDPSLNESLLVALHLLRWRQSSFPGVPGLLLPAPAAARPVLSNWRQPSEGHPFKPRSAPGTCLSLPASRATSSAARRLTATQQSPAATGHGRVCLYSCCLCLFPLLLWGSIATGTSCLPHTPPTISSSSCC